MPRKAHHQAKEFRSAMEEFFYGGKCKNTKWYFPYFMNKKLYRDSILIRSRSI